MSTTDSHAKNRGSKMSDADRKDAQMAANRRARLQWYFLGGGLAIVVVVVVVLISIYTEGQVGGVGHS